MLRKKLADEKNVPPFVIFSDVSLIEMSYYFPVILDNFARISGVGTRKLEEFGQIFINLISKYVQDKCLQSREIPVRRQRLRQPNRIARGRYLKTKEMINQKMLLVDIAKKQGFHGDTIVSHVEKLLASGEAIDINYLKPNQKKFDVINNAFLECGIQKLKPVFEFLEEKYSYEDIKLVRLFMG